jgi:urease accessory protein
MISFTRHLPAAPTSSSLTVELDHHERRRSRLQVTLSDGREAGIKLPRGVLLRDGDRLTTDDGNVDVIVRAKNERLSSARTDDLVLLARAAYHLGNRHVALSVRSGELAYVHDHVLDGMCRELGLAVEVVTAPFEPEQGGYGHHHD